MINLLGGRPRKEPDRQTEAYTNPWGWGMSVGNNMPTPKRTPANLRQLSESPVPRRAINVIKNGITRLNWSVSAIDENEAEKYQDICKIIETALLKPNPGDSFRSWVEQIVEDMLVCSAGASETLRAGDPLRPFRMYPVDAFSIELYPEWDGKPTSPRYAQRIYGDHVSLTDAEMMYIRMNPRTHTPFGLSPMEVVWESVNKFIDAHDSAGRQAGKSFVRKLINLGSKADKTFVDAFRDYWKREVQGSGITPIVGGAESPSILDLGAADDKALFIEWQRFLIEIVAIAFDISPKKLGQTKDVNRSTADSEDEDTESTIQSIAENLVEHINRNIIDGIFKLGGQVEFKFHYEASLKAQKAKADIHAIYLDRRTITPDEVRADNARKPLPNHAGEVVLQPSNLSAIDLNKITEDQEPPILPTKGGENKNAEDFEDEQVQDPGSGV